MFKGEEIALKALEKELERLNRKVARIQKEVNECIHIGSELVAINEEFNKIISSNASAKTRLKKIEGLEARSKKADKIMKKDITKLFKKETEALCERNDLKREVEPRRFILKVHSARRDQYE